MNRSGLYDSINEADKNWRGGMRGIKVFNSKLNGGQIKFSNEIEIDDLRRKRF